MYTHISTYILICISICIPVLIIIYRCMYVCMYLCVSVELDHTNPPQPLQPVLNNLAPAQRAGRAPPHPGDPWPAPSAQPIYHAASYYNLL